MSSVILSLVEHPELDWVGRAEYLKAKADKRRTELYAMDLLWLLTKTQMIKFGEFDSPAPSSVEWQNATRDTRSATQIKDDLLKKLRG